MKKIAFLSSMLSAMLSIGFWLSGSTAQMQKQWCEFQECWQLGKIAETIIMGDLGISQNHADRFSTWVTFQKVESLKKDPITVVSVCFKANASIVLPLELRKIAGCAEAVLPGHQTTLDQRHQATVEASRNLARSL